MSPQKTKAPLSVPLAIISTWETRTTKVAFELAIWHEAKLAL